MKSGHSLQEVVAEVQRQRYLKKDIICSTSVMKLDEEGYLDIQLPHKDLLYHKFEVTDIFHTQLAERIGIPLVYYSKMRNEAPTLLSQNINYWLHHNPQKRMVRTLGNRARAFLSTRYRRLDNVKVMEVVLPLISQIKGAKVISCELTERRLYLKVLCPDVRAEIRKGDDILGGFVLSNSEVGLGKVRVDPLVYREGCAVGMIMCEYGRSYRHIGRRVESGKLSYLVFAEEESQVGDKVFFLQLRDSIAAMMHKQQFNQIVGVIKQAVDTPIKNPVETVQVMVDKGWVSTSEKNSILSYFIKDGDLSKYGLCTAVARVSQNVAKYDRATELEMLGGRILTLPSARWVID